MTQMILRDMLDEIRHNGRQILYNLQKTPRVQLMNREQSNGGVGGRDGGITNVLFQSEMMTKF